MKRTRELLELAHNALTDDDLRELGRMLYRAGYCYQREEEAYVWPRLSLDPPQRAAERETFYNAVMMNPVAPTPSIVREINRIAADLEPIRRAQQDAFRHMLADTSPLLAGPRHPRAQGWALRRMLRAQLIGAMAHRAEHLAATQPLPEENP